MAEEQHSKFILARVFGLTRRRALPERDYPIRDRALIVAGFVLAAVMLFVAARILI